MARVYLDSCIVIYLLEGSPQLQQGIAGALEADEGRAPHIRVSDLTRLECRVGPLRRADHLLLAEYDAFFAQRQVICLALTAAVFDLAAELRAQYKLKTPDALHLAAAIRGSCDEIWTGDERFSAAAADRIRVRTTFA